MITIIYSTHKDKKYNDDFKQHLIQSVGLKDVQILEYINHNEYSLAQIYNRGVKESNFRIVVCCHNDIKLEKDWGKKLLEDFNNNPEYGILGKAGSTLFPSSGVYWERMQHTMVGQVYHQPSGTKKWLNSYSPKLPFIIPVVTIDGLFISFDKTKVIDLFDESIGKFHFYDHGFTLPNYLKGVKIGVTSSFEITHFSVGQPNQEFFESKDVLVKKYQDKLPLELKPREVYVPQFKTKPVKNIGKVAVIIPTKGKLDLLFQCVNSIIELTTDVDYEIFIADTGSTDQEKKEIKETLIEKHSNIIRLIEYDYYNFAKINNDVVKNHLDKTHEFILFCNNDVKLLNNVIWGMVRIHKSTPKAGTVGARLHFGDNTIQHDGVFCGWTQGGSGLRMGHLNFQHHYNYNLHQKKVTGNTAGLLMIRKSLFENIGGFNESYKVCFEDVELNLECLVRGFENIIDGSLVAYHFESQTRGHSEEQLKLMKEDSDGPLSDYIHKNHTKLKKWMNYIIQE